MTGIITCLLFPTDLIEEAPEAATTNPLAERLKQGAGSTFLLLIVKINTDSPCKFVYFILSMKKICINEVQKAEFDENLNGYGGFIR